MLNKLIQLLSIPQSTKKGYFVLLFLLLLSMIASYIYMLFYDYGETLELESYRKDIELFLAETRNDKYDKKNNFNNEIDIDNVEYSIVRNYLRPFPFEPNTIGEHQWVKMGFTKRQAQTIGKYLNKGGCFRVKSDLKKVYFITDEVYTILEPYILLPDSIQDKKYQKFAYQRIKNNFEITKIELNSCDSSDLVKLPGIGKVFARRIYLYKQKLGGFYCKKQLLEVFGMDSSRMALLEPYVEVNPWLIRKIDVNLASFEELASHPYISKNLAISLINYRIKHGTFTRLEDLRKLELIDDTLLEKLAPYLLINK